LCGIVIGIFVSEVEDALDYLETLEEGPDTDDD